jgi:hypothetical protein
MQMAVDQVFEGKEHHRSRNLSASTGRPSCGGKQVVPRVGGELA